MNTTNSSAVAVMERFSLLFFLLSVLVMVAPTIVGRTFPPERSILPLVGRALERKKADPTITTANNTDRSNVNELHLPKQHVRCSCC